MAKFLLFLQLFLFFFLFHFVKAQDYQPFRKGLTYQFINGTNDTITSVRVDSVIQSKSDSIYYFNWTYTKFNFSILDSNNVFGYAMLQKKNGDFIFFTTKQDSFLIKTKIPIGTKWIFNQKKGIEALYQNKIDSSINGRNDSIMVISLSDGFILKLSKNYGFIETVNFDGYFKNNFKRKLILNAIPEFQIGKFLSDPSIYFDFQPGDIFMYDLESYDMSYSAGKLLKKIISRTDYGKDSIVYRISRNQIIRSRDTLFSLPGNEYQEDTSTFTIRLILPTNTILNQNPATRTENGLIRDFGNNLSQTLFLLTKQPLGNFPTASNQIYRDSLAGYLFSGYLDYLFPTPRTTIVTTYEFVSHVSSINDFESGFKEIYYPKLGSIQYSEWHTGDYPANYNQHLSCYIKNNISVGDCQGINHFVLGTQKEINSKIELFPNPVNDALYIKLNTMDAGEKTVKILNTYGETIYTENLSPEKIDFKIETSNIKSGLYFIQIEGRKIYTKTFVKL